MQNILNEYVSQCREELKNPNDPMNRLSGWWEKEEQDVRAIINDLIKYLEEEKYAIRKYPKIVYQFVSFMDWGFEEALLNQVLDIMKKNIENTEEVCEFDSERFLVESAFRERYLAAMNPLQICLNKRLQESRDDMFTEML